MQLSPRGVGSGGLFRRLALPYCLFVLGASLAIVIWLQWMNRRESLRDFGETARDNARFVDRLRLPRSAELAGRLSEVLGVEVGFIREGEPIAGLPSGLAEIVAPYAGSGSRVVTSGARDLAFAPVDSGKVELVLLRDAGPFLAGPATWLLPGLMVSVLGGGIAAWVARRIVRPLAILAAWLPNLDQRESPEPLPASVTQLPDEIGALARSLEETHWRLVDETERRRQSERLASLGRIAASLAHEIRNPAAAIRLHADLLAAGASSESTESIGLIREEVDRITDLVSQWLYIARGAPPRVEKHNLSDLAGQVARRLGPQFDYAQVEFSLESDAEVPVAVDGPRLEQVVRNLLVNAMQAMPEGGRIRAAISKEDGRAVLAVHDEGPGFSREALSRWSEPFFSEREGGMGLGLTLAAEVVEAHGGALEVSNGREGAIVSCRLPAASEETP